MSALFLPGLQDSGADELLTIGSKAPDLNIEYWTSDRNGELPRVTAFQDGKVYVIEFWATWCGPCIASMPHIAELQDKYADQGVQIISVTDEENETVQKFLDGTVGDEDQKTYRELTAGYCLVADPDKSTNHDYLQAARQENIPVAFIVGKTGEIEWIGHPSEIEEPLRQVAAGQWDRTALQEKMRVAHAAAEKRRADLTSLAALDQEKKFDECLALVNEMVTAEISAGKEVSLQLKQMRLIYSISVGVDPGIDAMNQWAEENAENPNALSNLAYNVYSLSKKNEVDDALIERARQIAQQAVTGAREQGESGAGLSWKIDTVARLLYKQGNLDEAILVLQELLKDDSSAERSRTFLEQLEAEKKEDSKS